MTEKHAALKKFNALGRFLYWIGVMGLTIKPDDNPLKSKYNIATFHYRFWYPPTWVFVIIASIIIGVIRVMEEFPFQSASISIPISNPIK